MTGLDIDFILDMWTYLGLLASDDSEFPLRSFDDSMLLEYYVERSSRSNFVLNPTTSSVKQPEIPADAFALFQSGHVGFPLQWRLLPDELHVQARCKPQMKAGLYIVSLRFKTDRLWNAKCECPAGSSAYLPVLGPEEMAEFGGCCKHIGAVGLTLVYWCKNGCYPDYASCTSKACGWDVPKKPPAGPVPTCDSFSVNAPRGSYQPFRSVRAQSYVPLTDINLIDKVALDLVKTLFSPGCPAACLIDPENPLLSRALPEPDAFPEHPDEFEVSMQEFPKIPLLASDAQYHLAKSFWQQAYDGLDTDLQNFYNSVAALTLPQCQELFSATKGQSETLLWHQKRRNILTASKIHGVIVRRCAANESFLNSLVQPVRPTPAMRQGTELEESAVQRYLFEQMVAGKVGLQVAGAGLAVSPGFPYIGATPDRLVYDPTCESSFGVLEVKVLTEDKDPKNVKDPKKFRWEMLPPFDALSIEMIIDVYWAKKKELSPNFSFYLEKKELGWRLKRTHQYYHQVLTQLAVTGLAFCDFCVLFRDKVFVERIYVDLQKDWYNPVVLGKVTSFYFSTFLPFLYEHQLQDF